MRIGSSPFSAHQAGMSALWHDVDYIPEKRFETPLVHKGLQDLALPHEAHQLPEGVADPFQKMDEVFEAAAAQMERGLAGQAFLHGRPASVAASMAAETTDPGRRATEELARTSVQTARKGSPTEHKAVESVRADLEQVRLTNQAAAMPIATSRTGTKTAAEKEAVAAAPQASSVGDVLGTASVFLPMAAGQAVQGVVQGPLPALASQAVSIASAVAGAGQIASVGIAEGLKEETPTAATRDEPVAIRRGLAKKT